jgi:hypothetical protein
MAETRWDFHPECGGKVIVCAARDSDCVRIESFGGACPTIRLTDSEARLLSGMLADIVSWRSNQEAPDAAPSE